MAERQTFDDLVGLLRQQGLKFRADPQSEHVALRMRGHHAAYEVDLIVSDDDATLMLKVGNIAQIGRQNQRECFAALLELNHQFVLGNYEWDPEDGEVSFRIGVPLNDARLTPAQVHRLIGAACVTVDVYQPVIAKIVHGGRAPFEAIQECEAEFEAINS